MSYIHSYDKSVRRYHSGTSDGLLYAGQEGVQLTWMDAKVGNWVVTPRIGKPIEVNALWYNAFQPTSNLPLNFSIHSVVG
jgi:predicted glycogen debranching enzyme